MLAGQMDYTLRASTFTTVATCVCREPLVRRSAQKRPLPGSAEA